MSESELLIAEEIVVTLDSKFKDIEFDLDIEIMGNGQEFIKIIVKDLDRYLKCKNLRKWISILHKKYPKSKLKWFACYQNV